MLLPLNPYDADSTKLVVNADARYTLGENNHHFFRTHLTCPMENLDQIVETNGQDAKHKMSVVNRYVQSLCGLYSRVARQLRVDRSYVSRVARGERHSEAVEQAISTEFDRVMSSDSGEQRTQAMFERN